jgi:hypothetical protein
MRHLVPLRRGSAAGLAVLLLSASSSAQPSSAPDDTRPRVRLGAAATLGSPTGEFRDHVDVAGGFSGHAVYGAPARPLALRLDANVLLYGTESARTVVSGTGGRLLVDDVTTDNWMANVTLGPQVAATSGRLRPYANVFGGLSYFATTSQLPRVRRDEFGFFEPMPVFEPDLLFDSFLTTTHFDDTSFAYGGGAGVLVQLGRGSTALDLGVRYVANGRVRFLAEGDLEDGPGGATFSTRRSRADRLEIRLGLTAIR